MLDIFCLQKGQTVRVAGSIDASSRSDFQVLKVQEKVHRIRRLTTRRVDRHSLEVLTDSDAFRHNFSEHEKARRAMTLRRLLMESVDVSALSPAEQADYARFLRAQVRDISAIISARTREALAEKKERGECVGTAPFGSRVASDGIHLEADQSEQAVMGRILELKQSGLSTRRIAEELNRQGIKTRRGTDWRFQYVASALRSVCAER